MKYLGVIIALIPLLVVAVPNNFFGKDGSIFDPPNYTRRLGYQPSFIPRPSQLRIPVARPMMYPNPYTSYQYRNPYAYSYPYQYPYYPVPQRIPVYVPLYRPQPDDSRLDIISNIIGGFLPSRPNKQSEPIKEEEHHDDDHFGYGKDDGPETWPAKFPTCGGKNQSPIDISQDDLQLKSFDKLSMINYLAKPKSVKITNNGHSIQYSGVWHETPTIFGGPLNSKYEFKQMHIHWGMNDDQGSEHTVNKNKFPMEMHLVHWNKKYPSYEEAASQPDGLAVLGYFFDISPLDNPSLAQFIHYSSKVEGKDNKQVKVGAPLPLGILDLDCEKYATYQGSLTTPPCSEVVTWIVCIKKLPVSAKQMQELRTVVKDSKHQDIHNFRPPQPLNGRKVYLNA